MADIFNDLTEDAAKELFEKLDFKVIKTRITTDARKGRENEKWANILVKNKH